MPLDKRIIFEAIKELKEKTKKKNFVQSIEIIINLRDIDPKKPEDRIQELVELPNPAGKENKICVIARGEMAIGAKRAGADLVLERSDLEAFAGDKKKQKEVANTYDFFIAEASMMPIVGKILGTTLGPKGKMPTPVPPTADIVDQIERRRKTVLLRVRGQPVLQFRVGNENMPNEDIMENVQGAMEVIEAKLKKGIKNIKSIYLKTTMGSPVKLKA